MAGTAKKITQNYQTMQAELDELVTALQRDDVELDVALKHYRQGLVLIQRLEQCLREAENEVVSLKAKFDT